ncbi:MAG: redoxin domain-containing protein [Pirellulales bacterium]|nr:redoxin domain-containing protein [Pirellulales bacterium]
MGKALNFIRWSLAALLILGWGQIVLAGTTPSVELALQYSPIQKGVDYAQPSDKEIANCKIDAKKINGQLGWIVEDGNGNVLRRFVDTNGDNVVDLWCYYQGGEEVYRDIDADYNGKADQYRWLNSAGTRWGLDRDEDGAIDSWKIISAEEVSAEIVAALAEGDFQRFARVALTEDDLENLGLGKIRQEALRKKLTSYRDEFARAAERQKSALSDSRWVQFSGGRPGTIPAGADEATKDLNAYENVVAIVETGGKHAQVFLGTLVQVGDVWKAVDLPAGPAENKSAATAGTFFQPPMIDRPEMPHPGGGETLQKLLDELSRLDEQMAGGVSAEQIANRAELLEKISAQAGAPEERGQWLRQLADMLGAAVQMKQCPDGLDRLKKLSERIQKDEADQNLAAYVCFTQLTAEHTLALQAPKTDFAKVQTEWQAALKQFLDDYPKAPVSAEAMLQLAIGEEFAGQDDAAVKWYDRVAKEFPDTSAGKKALGARNRLASEGKAITLGGRSVSGTPLDLNQFRGKTVLIQYWATWSDPSKNDMPVLKDLLTKYGRDFTVLGINVDPNRQDLEEYLKENKLPWPQIFEEGGLDSPPANQLGILTVPTMILVDPQGRVVNRNIQASEIEKELKKLIKVGKTRRETRR